MFARGTYAAGAQPTEPSGLRVHHLPTAEADATERELTDLDVGDFLDVAIDPGQDLIVIIRRSPTRPQSLREVLDDQDRTSYELLLLDMDGRPKRNAAGDVLAVDVRTLYPPITASAFPIKDARPLLHIQGDTLAVMVGETDTMERDAIFAWNWRTGEELCVRPHPSSASRTRRLLSLTQDPRSRPPCSNTSTSARRCSCRSACSRHSRSS